MIQHTPRDQAILDALTQTRCLTAAQIEHLWFPSRAATWRRMQALVADRAVSRFRWIPSNQVVYHLPRHHLPRDLAHALAISDVWVDLRAQGVDLTTWALGLRLGTVQPDAVCQGRMIEVDRGTESWRTLRSKLLRYEAQGGACVWWSFTSASRASHAPAQLAHLGLVHTCWHRSWAETNHARNSDRGRGASVAAAFERRWAGWS